MKIKVLLAIAFCLITLEGIAFSGNGNSTEGKFLIASQENSQVELYVTSWCPYCRKAIDFFRSKGIYYVVYDVERDENAARRKKELDPRNGVPFAVVNGVKIHGYSPEAYQKALDQR
jgi:glutaredoxin